MKKDDFLRGLRAGLPIGLGYFPVSFAFGILAAAGGLYWWQGTIISLMCVTSAGQFAGLETMLAAGSLLEMAASQLVINLRYSLMSITLSQKVDESVRGIRRFIFPYSVTDEIFGVASTRKSVSYSYWHGLRVLPVLGWTLGTLSGALLGSVLPENLLNAMGAMLYAMFIAIIVPVAKRRRPVLCACLIAIGLNCLLSLFARWFPRFPLSSGMRVIISAVAASLLMALISPQGDTKEKESRAAEAGEVQP